MLKRIISFLTGVSVFVTLFSFACFVFADDTNWDFDDNSQTLYINGSGPMNNYTDQYSTPWNKYMLSIQNVVVGDGITSIGDYAFSGAANLKCVSLSDTVNTVGINSFAMCSSLTSITFSDKITSIADSSFAYNGITPKNDFYMKSLPGSYALYYAVKNNISFQCESVRCGVNNVKINPKGMRAYYPYTAKVNGKFKFYSTGSNDTVGELLDSNFKRLSYNDDSSSGNTNFSISYELKKGETYYISSYILNPSLVGSFDLVIEPVSYSVKATITAMKDRAGTPSDILLSGALVDGKTVDSTFYYDVTNKNQTVNVKYENVEKTYIFSPDNGDEIYISLMMCDMNHDRVVNLKDYQYMLSSKSQYLDLFPNFVNYKY